MSGHGCDSIAAVGGPNAGTIARCRELLGDEAIGLSDDDVDRMRRHADAMAHLVVEMFMQSKQTGA